VVLENAQLATGPSRSWEDRCVPDRRTLRGPHPKDRECFSPAAVETLGRAVADLSWLLGRGYSAKASLKLVGDRHALRDRQRKALRRCAAGDEDCARRRRSLIAIPRIAGQRLVVDGYNVLLTVEAALSGGVLLLGRDGVLRDMAAMSGHYRRVRVTRQAVQLIAAAVAAAGCAEVRWLLDRPVSNSGRLRRLIQEGVAGEKPRWTVELTDRTDRVLALSPDVVASADSAILDRCRHWCNLARHVVETAVPEAWVVDLSQADPPRRPPVGRKTPCPSHRGRARRDR
jgi:hypothetical protein